MATIASTGYAKVSSSIRNLLFIEPVTQNYLRKLAFLTSYSVLTLLLITFGYNPGNLIILILVFLGLSSLFSLLKLGAGVYNLFEPETLSKIVNKEINKDINNVTINSIYWENPNFQNYFRNKVEKNIEKIRLINELGFEGVVINNKSFLNTVSQTFNLLNVYLYQKNKIPVNSKWFKEKNYHKSFFETGTSERQLALDTKTYVQAKSNPNNFWFEEEIFQIYKNIGQKLTSIDNQNIKYDYLLKSIDTARFFGHQFEYELISKLLTENLAISINSIVNSKNSTYEDSESNLILAETYILSIRDFQLAFFNNIENLHISNFNKEIDKINWNKKSTIYNINLPPRLYMFLEEYFNNIKNEIIVEGKQITPNWYILQHITAEYLYLLEIVFTKCIEQIENFILPLIERCEKEKNSLLVSFLCHLTLEIIDKIEFRLPTILKITTDFERNNLYKGNFNWTSIDEEKSRKKLSIIREKLLLNVSKNMPKIVSIEWNNNYPDIFAQSFSIISNELNKSYILKDIEKFKLIFPKYLKSSLIAFLELHKRYKGKYRNEFDIIYQVHIELMQICGLGYIYSKLSGIEFWEEIISNWDKFTISNDEINLFIASYTFYKRDVFGTGLNYYENLNRSKSLFEYIKSEKIQVQYFEKEIIYKYIYSDSFRNSSYEDIFIEMYLFTFIEAKESAISLNKINLRDLFNYINRLTDADTHN